MDKPTIGSREAWLQARRALLAREKELTRMRDQVARERRALPWVRVEEDYVFHSIVDGEPREESLSELFDGRSQLLVYHFMFDPSWDAGCKSCSIIADSYDGSVVHLAHRDITLVTVSRAPIGKLEAFRERMGWSFKWVSSAGSGFNYDFQVSHTPEELATGLVDYNFTKSRPFGGESPGISAFVKDEEGAIFHTYSSYGRGLDSLMATYHYADLTAKGRDEAELPYPMAWVRLHDSYEG